MNNIFTENLKKFRLAKGFTQEQVADKLNVNTQTISRWECGTTLPDVLTLPELAKLYEVTVEISTKRILLHMTTTHSVSLLFLKKHMTLKILSVQMQNLKSL